MTGVQTCALPIYKVPWRPDTSARIDPHSLADIRSETPKNKSSPGVTYNGASSIQKRIDNGPARPRDFVAPRQFCRTKSHRDFSSSQIEPQAKCCTGTTFTACSIDDSNRSLIGSPALTRNTLIHYRRTGVKNRSAVFGNLNCHRGSVESVFRGAAPGAPIFFNRGGALAPRVLRRTG